MYNDNIKVILFCEIIINLGFLYSWISWISWFTQNLKIKIQRNTNFPIDCFLYRLKPGIQEPKDHGILLKFTNANVNEQK